MTKHTSCVKMLGDFLKQTVGSPTNVAVARIGYLDQEGNVEIRELEQFFCSKTRLKAKSTGTLITDDVIQRFLQTKNEGKYLGFDSLSAELYKSYKTSHSSTYDGRDKFKEHLKGILTASTSLHQERSDMRHKELDKDRMDFFYHSEQGIVLSVLNDAAIWEDLFKSLDFSKEKTKIQTVFVNIATYFDPCIRCGDTMLRLSEDVLMERMKKYCLEQKIDTTFLENTKVIVEAGGVIKYRDPDLSGIYSAALRPAKGSLEDQFRGDTCNPINHIPKVACTAMEWLQ